ncbi:MAG TPA: hypothetical protein VFC44_26595 [Candidatus Saccharimonadales bacterium]|nr:hypothetical protein [Candidatus Saccharimonadales bacterium]
MAQKLEKVEGEKFLYQHTMSKVYYIRIRTETEDTERSLNTTKKQMAVKLRDKWMAARTTEKFGIEEPKPAPKRLRIDQALDDYKKAGFASIRRGKLTHPGIKHLRTEQDAIPTLKGFFKTKHVDELAPDLLDEYRTWREKNVTKGDGAKTTDLELNTLSKSLDWAVRKGRLVSNPIKARARYYNPSKARHCKELAASNPEELHQAAALLFEDPRGEALAWQFLWESNFGMRTEETLALRRDAKNTEEPGFISGESMYVRRAEKNADNPAIYLHLEGRILLEAMDQWTKVRYPDNPWYFPGRSKTDGDPLSPWSLTTALDRLFEKGKTPKKLTSHGGRAFYVLVRRSNGVHDSQIAVELNQVGGLETLRTSYGVVPLHWLQGKGPKLKWLPIKKEDYAWAKLFAKLGLKIGDVVPAATV